MNTKTRTLTVTALMTAVALGIFVAEAQIPFFTWIPGIKLGLANVVTVFAIYVLGAWPALCIVLLRVLLGCLATGQMMAFLYSMAGGLLRQRRTATAFFPGEDVGCQCVCRNGP